MARGLGERRRVREASDAVLRPHVEQPHLAGEHRLRPHRALRDHLHVARQHALQRLRAAAERDVGELDALAPGPVLHGQVRRGADARRRVGHRSRVAPRGGEEVGEGAVGAVGAHRHPEGPARQADDVAEVRRRVPGGVARQEGAADHRQVHLADGVSVRPRLAGEEAGVQRAAGAGAVLHHHGLAEVAPGLFGERAELAVGGAARRPGHDQADRPVGEAALGRGGRGERGAAQKGEAARQAMRHGKPPGLGPSGGYIAAVTRA